MPITDSYFVRGKVSLEEVCKLYKELIHYEEESDAFIHAKNHGIREGYNGAVEKVTQLISKAKEHGLYEFFPFFKNCIETLEKAYHLK